MPYKIEIDGGSGFCFGVVNAIEKAEQVLKTGQKLYCLGDIVHNGAEVKRLESMGMETIGYEQFEQLKNVKVLLRAHGEPPETYEIARKNNISLIDATCPVVLKLQQRVKKGYTQAVAGKGTVIIYGKKGHAEVNGLVGQTNNEAHVVETTADLEGIDFNRPVYLYSQTTKQEDGLREIEKDILARLGQQGSLELHNSICRQVSGRLPGIQKFAKDKDIIFFVSGKKSSNGRMLFEACKVVNKNSYMIASAAELDVSLLNGVKNIGICGATSTPRWLMDEMAEKINHYLSV